MDFYQLWFAVRYLHVASVTLLSGGALLITVLCLAPDGAGLKAVLAVASAYEWIFWSVAGVTVATGVSNLGLKGNGLLGPHTVWGTALSIKLVVVLVLLVLSALRSDIVVRGRARTQLSSSRFRMILGGIYAATVTMILAALWLGLGLAHGRY